MKKTLPYVYLAGALLMPATYALAHNGVDDGDEDVADPSKRIYVMIGVGIVFALMIGWYAWSKVKSKAPMGAIKPETTTATTPPPTI